MCGACERALSQPLLFPYRLCPFWSPVDHFCSSCCLCAPGSPSLSSFKDSNPALAFCGHYRHPLTWMLAVWRADGVVHCVLMPRVSVGKELGCGCMKDIQAAALSAQGWAAGRSPSAARESWRAFAHHSAAWWAGQKDKRSGELSRKAAAKEWVTCTSLVPASPKPVWLLASQNDQQDPKRLQETLCGSPVGLAAQSYWFSPLQWQEHLANVLSLCLSQLLFLPIGRKWSGLRQVSPRIL